MPWRSDHIDVGKAQASVIKRRLQTPKWEPPRMLLAVEPFLLQDQGWDAAFKYYQPRVMCSSYDSENAHGLKTDVDDGATMFIVQRATTY
jgi:hypothetical protein